MIAINEDLVRRDSALSGLGLVLDADRLLEVFSRHLDRTQVAGIRPDYLRYKPGMNCLVRYQIRVGEHSVYAYAKAHGSDMSAKLEKADARLEVETTIGPGRMVLEDRGIVFSFFPNDAKLPSLLKLQDDNSRHRFFSRIFGPDSGWSDGQVVDVLNYKPERRHVVRVQRNDGESALLKFHTRSGFKRMCALSQAPRVIGASRKHAAIAYEWQVGTSLGDFISGDEVPVEYLVATATELAAFHASHEEGLLRPDPATKATRLKNLAEQTVFLVPQLRTRILRIAAELITWLGERSTRLRPVHGDFYYQQVIIGGGKAHLIDFDNAHLDDPLLDLGNFGAHLERRIISNAIHKSAAQEQWRVLITAYEKVAGTVRERELDKYVAMGLFQLIHDPFRYCEEEWQEKMELILARAESLLG